MGLKPTMSKSQFSLRILFGIAFLSATLLIVFVHYPSWISLAVAALGLFIEKRLFTHAPSPASATLSLWKRVFAVCSGLVNGGLVVFLLIVCASFVFSIDLPTRRAIVVSLLSGVILGLVFPRFFNSFYFPLP